MSAGNLLEALTDNLVVDKTKCIFCGKCAETCILDNIRINRAPCSAACPLGLNIQGYVQLVARGKDDEARAVIAQDLPFAQLICRICDHPCEHACNRCKIDGQAVNINGIKRYLFAGEKMLPLECAEASGKTVAVIGAGPAGLLAAHDLRKAGHAVSVYEAEGKAGGLLRNILPVWKLPDAVLDEVVGIMEQAGVVFHYGQRIVDKKALDDLSQRYDAVVLALGAGGGRKASIEGEELPGVLSAFRFLMEVRAGGCQKLSGHVVVVGGGYVALDSAQAAMRQGAESVTIVYRRTIDAFRADAEDIAKARKQGIKFAFTWAPVKVEGKNGKLALSCRHDLELLPPQCLDYPDFKADEIRSIEADSVIMAVGQERDSQLTQLVGDVTLDPVTLQLGDKAIFAAGDMEHGPSSAVYAMASGRRAATSIIRLLAGQDMFYGRQYAGPYVDDFTVDTGNAVAIPRQTGLGHFCTGTGDFTETTQYLTEQEARDEASRCLSCGGPTGHYRNCWFCLPCEVECPQQALYVNIPYLLR